MENRAHFIAAGVFVLLMLLGLLATLSWFQGDHTARSRYIVVSRNGVAGLNVKAPVKLRGVEVGKVESIVFDPADTSQILITLSVDTRAPITRGTFAQLGFQGVTGLSFIDLGDSGTDRAPLAGSLDTPPRLVLRPTLLDQLAAIGPKLLTGADSVAERLNDVLKDDNRAELTHVLKRLGSTLDQLSVLVATLQPAAQRVPALVEHVDALGSKTDHLLDGMQDTLVRVDGLASDTRGLATDARGLVADLRAQDGAINRLAAAGKQVEVSTRNIESALVGPVARTGPPLIDELDATTRSLQRVLRLFEEQPQSVLFGRHPVPPGPGESGFDGASSKVAP